MNQNKNSEFYVYICESHAIVLHSDFFFCLCFYLSAIYNRITIFNLLPYCGPTVCAFRGVNFSSCRIICYVRIIGMRNVVCLGCCCLLVLLLIGTYNFMSKYLIFMSIRRGNFEKLPALVLHVHIG